MNARHDTSGDELRYIASVLRAEGEAVLALIDRVGPTFGDAVGLIVRCADSGGSVLVTGLGKSGIIGMKLSATLASLGIPSHDIHPSEAAHGDLGRIRSNDCVIALSHSGETEEVVALCGILRQDGVPIVSITGGEGQSALARLANVALALGTIPEAGDLSPAPTCSTTAALAVGDAIALAAARRRAFTADDFARRHPGGTLGGLLRPVTDVLRFVLGDNLPIVDEKKTLRDALTDAQSLGRRPGAVLIVDDRGALSGIFTDGDLRRLILNDPTKLDAPIKEVMTASPRTLGADALVRDAVRLVREYRQDEIPIVDDNNQPIGVLDVQDLMALKVVEDPHRIHVQSEQATQVHTIIGSTAATERP